MQTTTVAAEQERLGLSSEQYRQYCELRDTLDEWPADLANVFAQVQRRGGTPPLQAILVAYVLGHRSYDGILFRRAA